MTLPRRSTPPTVKQIHVMRRNIVKRQHKRERGNKKDRRKKSLIENGMAASSQKKHGLLQWLCRPEFLNIYNEINRKSQKRMLTQSCVRTALKTIAMPDFNTFDLPTSHVMFFDQNQGNRLIGFVEFTPFSAMSQEEREDVDFLADFLHSHKNFTNSLSSFNGPALGGNMNMLGWRKCMKPNERIGIYLSQPKITRRIDEFTEFVSRGYRAGEIVGRSFERIADNAFKKNQNLMSQLGMPSFSDSKLNEEGSKFSSASSLAYTYNGFFNTPHADQKDVSEFAYVQWIPTFRSSGKVATQADGFNLLGGDFVFPDCKFRINFDRLDGVARMVWRATEYRHFTLQPQANSTFTRLGFSLQLNSKTANVFENMKRKEDAYSGCHDGDVEYIMKTAEEKLANKKKK